MRVILVRHGDPDYLRDCLTQNGHKHAAAVAQRLADEGISEIYSSPCGRAYETASYTALLLNLPIVKLDFMREISWAASAFQTTVTPGCWLKACWKAVSISAAGIGKSIPFSTVIPQPKTTS